MMKKWWKIFEEKKIKEKGMEEKHSQAQSEHLYDNQLL